MRLLFVGYFLMSSRKRKNPIAPDDAIEDIDFFRPRKIADLDEEEEEEIREVLFTDRQAIFDRPLPSVPKRRGTKKLPKIPKTTTVIRKTTRKKRAKRRPSIRTTLLKKLKDRRRVIKSELRSIERDIISLTPNRLTK